MKNIYVLHIFVVFGGIGDMRVYNHKHVFVCSSYEADYLLFFVKFIERKSCNSEK